MAKKILLFALLFSCMVIAANSQTPTVSSFSPTSASKGATITITGTNFTGATAVSFGGTAAISFTVVSSTSITAVVAGGSSGNVSVTTPGGTASLAGFTYNSPNAYIYIHQKTLNEQSAVDFNYTMTGASTTTSFSLNNNPAWIQIGDIGAGHGTTASGNGDGELWVIGNSASASYGVAAAGLTGAIYRRPSASAQWSATNVTTNVLAIDGAYYNQCVYVSGGNAYFYYNGTSTQIYSGGDAKDITAGGGNIAIYTTGNVIKVYNKQYVAGASINTTSGAWTTLTGINTSTATRIDFNVGGTSLLSSYINGTTENAYTTGITVSGGNVTKGSTATAATFTASTDAYGNSIGGAGTNPDVAFDDKGYIYILAKSQIFNAGDAVYSNTSGSFVYEPQSRAVQRITASCGGQAWGVIADGTANTIWARNTDGTHIWIDDERVRVTGVGYTYKTGGGTGTGNTNTGSGVANGNVIMIPVVAGTYTVTETLPDATWDLGRYTNYVPATSSVTTNVSTQQVTITVAAGDVVHVQYFNEKLSPKAIALTCTASILEDFGVDATGNNTFGDTVQGTAYHYYPQGSTGTPTAPQDGKYYTVKDLSHWFVTNGLQSHTNPGTGYFLVVNASYAADEFYRKRVTNLVPGLQYTITFYAANINFTTGTTNIRIPPNVSFGLQDQNGNVIQSSASTTGSIDSTGPTQWELIPFTFTATTSQADFFLRNNTIGGLGNDIAIDDISLNPVITPLGNITVSPAIAPNVCIGTTYTFSNSQSGGVWTASPSSVATVTNANTGKIKGIAPGNATVTYSYTNAIGCTSTTSTGIIVSPKPTVTTSDLLGGTSCLNQTDSLFSTPSGGTTPYTYTWSELSGTGTGGLGTATIQNTTATPTAAGNYTYLMTLTDAVGCSATSSVSLTVSSHTAPTVTAGISSAPYCSNSAINLTSSATGGSGSYTYTWSASPTGNGLGTTTTQNTTATPTAAGTYAYKIVVNDGFCNVPKTVSATVNAAPSVTVTGPTGTQQLCTNASYAITSTPSGGSGSYTYAWTASKVSGLDNGPGLQSPTNTQNVTAKPTLTLSTALTPDVYKYSLTITDGNGCTASGSANVTAYLNALGTAPTVGISAPSSATAICLGGTITLTGSASGGSTPYTYSWTGPNSYTSTALSPGTITPSATGTGTYTLTVTGNNGCKASATSPAVTVNPAPTVVATSFAATLCSNTVDSVYATASGGTAPYTYLWTSNSSSGGFAISQTTKDTSAVTGGSNNTTYTLTMTVTDAKNCQAAGTTTVKRLNSNGPSNLTVTASSTGKICINTAQALTSSVTVGASAISTYTWTGSPTGNGIVATNTASTTATPTAAGSYIYTLKEIDGNGCAVQKSTGTQTVNSALVVTTTADAPGFCGANSSVNLVASPTGGSGTYTNYAWTTAVKVSPGTTTVNPTSSTTTGVTTATISGATVGTSKFQYFAVVTDNAGCTGSDSSDVLVVGSTPTFTTAPTATISSACVGQTFNLSATSFTGGTASYNYSWTAPTSVTVANATGTVNASPIPATTAPASVTGNYNFGLLVVDGNNCKVTASVAASTINPVPVITLASDDYSVCKTPATTINLTGSFTTATTSPYTYAWTGSGLATNTTSTNTNTAVPTATGTYSVTVTDANGCTGNGATSTVTVNNSPAITASADKTVACATPATTVNLTSNITTGTTSPYTYSWSGSGVANASSSNTTATPTAAGSYSITVTDANGCTATGTTGNVAYDALTANVTFGNCGTTSGVKYGQLNETNGSTWLWTTADGGRFYTTNALSASTDSSTSHLQAPYITFLGTYNVAITDGNNCTATGAVTVTSSSCSVILAVSNLSFTAQKQGNTVQLDWKTTTEINNDHFDVERSKDGINWQVIGTVKGHGNSSTPIQYNYTDALPLNGINYYRLKQTDADGKFTYSQVKTVQFTGQWLVKLYPNPVKGFMVLEFNNDRDEKGAIVIQTMAGSTIFATEKQLVKGLNRITLNQVQPLAQGTYMVTLGTQNNIFRSKFVKTGN
jgi:hypothetical protein